jgi:hypothetical protein
MFGVVVFVLTVTVVFVVHPLTGLVTVNVYTPALVVVPLAALFGVTPALQAYVAPKVVELPLTVTVDVVQVMVWLAPAEIFGVVVFVVTEITPVVVQPFAGLVIVKV